MKYNDLRNQDFDNAIYAMSASTEYNLVYYRDKEFSGLWNKLAGGSVAVYALDKWYWPAIYIRKGINDDISSLKCEKM